MKTLVLVSGGLDSCVALASAVQFFGPDKVLALTILYGQRHAKEIEAATKICKVLGVKQRVVELPGTLLSGNLLTDDSKDIPRVSYNDISGLSPMYVPFRNGLFLSIAGAIAMQEHCREVRIAVHKNDYIRSAYPDCSLSFCDTMSRAMMIGTANQVKVVAPFVLMTKKQIVEYGKALDAPMHLSWSCYVGKDTPCGTCPTCREREEAFDEHQSAVK